MGGLSSSNSLSQTERATVVIEATQKLKDGLFGRTAMNSWGTYRLNSEPIMAVVEDSMKGITESERMYLGMNIMQAATTNAARLPGEERRAKKVLAAAMIGTILAPLLPEMAGAARACLASTACRHLMVADLTLSALDTGAMLPTPIGVGRQFMTKMDDLIALATVRGEYQVLKNAYKNCSFAGNTPVLMADGRLKPISLIEIGNIVASRNEVTGLQGANRVTALPRSVHTDQVIVQLENSNGATDSITTTLEHPFHVQGYGFIRADKLVQGMLLTKWQPHAPPVQTVGHRAADTTGHLLVKAITITRSGLKSWHAYNLSVEKDHTFFVGKSKVWVHNNSSCELAAKGVADLFNEAIKRALRRNGTRTDGVVRWIDGPFLNRELAKRLDNAAGNPAQLQAEIKAIWLSSPATSRGVSFEAYLAKARYPDMINTKPNFKDIDFVTKGNAGTREAISLKTMNYDALKNPDASIGSIVKHITDLGKKRNKNFPAPVGRVDKITVDLTLPRGQTLSTEHLRRINEAATKAGISYNVKNL